MELSGKDRATLRKLADKSKALNVLTAELAEAPDVDDALRQYWTVANALFALRDDLTALYIRLVYGEEG